ncbi:MAG: hypothetical protein FWC61_02825 [Proteobacteria bacterium]|nr:hypothetical protein [Pseudomonadota bacterium]
MSDILEQIFTELDGLAESASKLRAAAAGASKQTDLEVAILTQQIADLREKNAKAGKFIDQASGILAKLTGNKA